MKSLNLSHFLQTQSLSKTIEVLDEMLYVLVLNVELSDTIPDNLCHQYLILRGLRDLFIQLKQEEDGQ